MLNNLIYYPSKEHIDNPSNHNIIYKDIIVNDIYHGWLIEYTVNNKPEFINNKYILFLHGNAGNISNRMAYIVKFYNTGFNMLIIDYPGFGISKGTASRKENLKCCALFLKYLVNTLGIKLNNIILYGESIGGYFAIELANMYNIKYLILQSTFTNLNELVKSKFSIGLLTKYINLGYDNIENIKKRYKRNKIEKKLNTLVIHSKTDELIPFEHSTILEKYSTSFYECDGKHSSPVIDNKYINAIIKFISN